jgi:segregation and condensation protein B
MTSISSTIEAFLFSEGGPVRKTRLAQLVGVSAADLEKHLDELQGRLSGGLTLVRTETEAALVIGKEASEAVRESRKKEMGEEIGDAGLEVLAIILYRGASTRAQIDYVRGVNTASTVRNLLARGLLERVGNPLDGREYIYRPTTELLAHLGVSEVKDLPEYAIISRELATFESQRDHSNMHASTTDPINNGGAS